MSTLTLAVRRHFSPLTRPIGPGKYNQTFTVTVLVACLFDRMAKAWVMSKNAMLRKLVVSGAEAENHPMAGELRSKMGLPSIYEPNAPEEKARIIEDDFADVRASNDMDLEEYVSEFRKAGTN